MTENSRIERCVVTEIGSWGIFALISATKERLFVPFGELSWNRLRSAEDAFSLGQEIHVLVADAPTPDRPYHLGSIKRLTINERKQRIRKINLGDTIRTEIIRVGEDVVFVFIESFLTGVPVPVGHHYRKGETITVTVCAIDIDRFTVEATIEA